MKDKLVQRVKRWLGLTQQEVRLQRLERLTRDLVSIGVDVHFKEPHMILIYSRLNGGQIREIRAQFESIRDLDELVRGLRERYGTSAVTWDMPRHMKPFIL